MKNRYRAYIEITIHAICWIVFTLLFVHYNALNFQYLEGDFMDLPLIIGTVINGFLFYFNLLFLFPRYTSKKFNVLLYTIFLIVLIIVTSVIENSFDYYLTVHYFPDEEIKLQTEELFATSFINLSFIVLSVLYAIIGAWLKNETVRRKLTEEKLKLELNYLKSQINPHFLFNTLNNLYSTAIKNDDAETAKGITRLSGLMRFMLDKSDKSLVKLEEEIEYIKSFIELQKLRFLDDDDLKISFNIKGIVSDFHIPPFLLINFVENAFKHGIDYKQSSSIIINMEVDKEELTFTIENSKHASNKTNDNNKVGLLNAKKQLDLLYGNNYELIINSNPEVYVIKLKIKNLNNSL